MSEYRERFPFLRVPADEFEKAVFNSGRADDPELLSELLTTDSCPGRMKKVAFMIEKAGFDVNGLDCGGRTPLMLVRSVGVALYLIGKGADVTARCPSAGGKTVLMYLLENLCGTKKGLAALFDEVLSRGADPNEEDWYGRTALDVLTECENRFPPAFATAMRKVGADAKALSERFSGMIGEKAVVRPKLKKNAFTNIYARCADFRASRPVS